MAKQHLLILAATLVAIVATCSAAKTSSAMNSTLDAAGTAYDVLVKNNLPRGILPKGVQSYDLQSDGTLSVKLSGECNIAVTVGGEVYKMRFGSTVAGVIKPGSIHGVRGVRVQVRYGWLGISGIDHVGDQIMIAVQQGKPLPFPVSSFSVSPSCS